MGNGTALGSVQGDTGDTLGATWATWEGDTGDTPGATPVTPLHIR